ncbi:PIN domain-containing protein [Candidatus Chloroploca sp. Khr17]|uniref:PIN domain-containing protein n=1 Tax=Candidatus Chloroploca sp. Khr17 TaxID=2496869 RepID=UPI00101DEB0E|nr:PIN domain-containing protein [Candidatus Chloroploca sp. Khr17]
MKVNYVLIDYENVQPTDVQMLYQDYFHVIMFLGVNQSKIPYEIVSVFQEMGNRVKYIKMSSNGSNALDFHIAFYIGQLTKEYPEAYFHIISNDAGFDPLIQHLRERKIFVSRSKSIQDMPMFRTSPKVTVETEIKLLPDVSVKAAVPAAPIPTNLHDRITMVRKDLQNRGNARPKTVEALLNTINSLFRKTLSQDELSLILRELHSH